MTRDTVLTAINEGIPFVIRMADGQKYQVRDRYGIAVGPANAVVMDVNGLPHILPLLTMTGISYLPARSGKKK
jgi:hypothetical protein